MSVVNIFTGQPKPGRHEDAIEMGRGARKLLERHGAKDQRLMVATVSTAAYGSIISSAEFDDLEAWGAFMDAVYADDEIAARLTKVRGEKSPYLAQSLSLATEIPLGRARGPRGNVLWAYVTTPVPGGFEAALALAGTAYEVLERHGARNCRLWQQQPSGVQPELLVSTFEFDNMRALGKTLTSFQADPAGLAITGRLQSSDSPNRPLSSDVYMEVGD
jgi:hypothetical protein